MRSLAYIGVLLVPFCVSLNANAQKTKTDANAPQKMLWEDPRKGKIFEKVNVVQIPLTANENHMMGAVRTIKYKDYKVSYEGAKYNQQIVDSGINTYDRYGHLVDQNQYKPNGSAEWNCVYKYDGKNKATERNFKFANAAQNGKTTFKYDDKGNEIESYTVNDQGSPTEKETKKYDEKGNLVEDAIYDASGKLKQMQTYKYDSRNYQTEWIHTDADGKTIAAITCEYDAAGNKTSGTNKSKSGAATRWTQTNDPKTREIETMSYNSDGSTEMKTTRHYDVYGNTIEYRVFKKDGTLDDEKSDFYDYGYDDKGNIIKEVTFKMKDGKRKMVSYTNAEVTYY